MTASLRSVRRQEGVVLFIALIVLVAMSLAGIAMIRSVDTTLGIAGNLAFKQATVQASDRGVASAYGYISTPAVPGCGVALQCDDAANGYFAELVTDPNWFDPANWGTAVDVFPGSTDAAGNRIRYIIHRMCNAGGNYNAVNCVRYIPIAGAGTGSTMTVGSYQFQGTPQVYYRITTRVDGPRNTVSITQTFVIANGS